ncbi:ATP-binding protein [Kiloniella litopenaei]|uniref:ATP-binding protein n=1 Tax=Kiloniella litopenaei TaxID=1549748 RepID=UPI0006963D5C|nr:ATP-binding protein [Kiloniella litopenaei]
MSTGIQSSLYSFGRATSFLYLSIIVLLFGGFITAVYKLENYAITQQENAFNNQQLLQTQITKRALQNSIDNIQRFSLDLANEEKNSALFFPLDKESLEKDLTKSMAYNPAIIGVNFYDKNQTKQFSNIQNFNWSPSLENIMQEWVSQSWIALRSPEINLIVPSFHVEEKAQFFAILVPIRNQEGFQGSLATIVDLGLLSQKYVAPLRSGQHGAGYMLNENGVILYDHETEIIGRSVYDGLHKGKPEVQRVDQRLLGEKSGQDEYRFSITRAEENNLYRKLIAWDTAFIDNKKFVIALSAPDTEIVGPIQGLRQQGIFLAIFLSLGLVTVTILFYRNTNKALIRTARRLEEEVKTRTTSLNKIEQSFRDTVENAGIGFYRTTPDGNFLMANPYLVQMNNCQSEEELIKTAQYNEDNWYVEKDRRQEFMRLIDENGFVEGFVSQIKAYNNQEEKWISETARAIKDDDGNTLFYEGTAQDVTHLMQLKEAHKTSEANLKAHIAAMPDLGMIFSLKGKIINVYGDTSLLHASPETMLHKSLTQVMPNKVANEWLELIKITAATGQVQSKEYRLSIKSIPKAFEARSALIKGQENTPDHVVILIRDVTQHDLNKQAMLTAMENADIANRSKTEFLANMSHELRTPLNAILGYSEIMEKSLFGPIENTKYQEYIADIHTSGSHLLDIINDILDLSKIEAGSYNLEEEKTSLPILLAETDRIIGGSASAKNIEYTKGNIENIPLWADARAIKQILINILSNAFKFTPNGGSVSLDTLRHISGLDIIIEDSGIGMDQADLPRILEPFVRIGTSQTTEASGTGIGLSLTKKLIEFHQGTLKVESELGKGTKVTITLPNDRIFKS